MFMVAAFFFPGLEQFYTTPQFSPFHSHNVEYTIQLNKWMENEWKAKDKMYVQYRYQCMHADGVDGLRERWFSLSLQMEKCWITEG